jgi:hypothetical protein
VKNSKTVECLEGVRKFVSVQNKCRPQSLIEFDYSLNIVAKILYVSRPTLVIVRSRSAPPPPIKIAIIALLAEGGGGWSQL